MNGKEDGKLAQKVERHMNTYRMSGKGKEYIGKRTIIRHSSSVGMEISRLN